MAKPAFSLDDALACVRVSDADFDVSEELQALRQGDASVGAVVSFVGTVRQWAMELPIGVVAAEQAAMELEHYPGMTECSIAELILEAKQRFDVKGIRVIHRIGRLTICDQIVLVAVTSTHRGSAFQCAEFLMDWLKTKAPFWKKEILGDQGRWVDARVSDEQAAARWGQPDL